MVDSQKLTFISGGVTPEAVELVDEAEKKRKICNRKTRFSAEEANQLQVSDNFILRDGAADSK